MQERWLKGIPKGDQEQRIKDIKSCRKAFDLLKELLEGEFEEMTPDYDCPSWSHKQADQNGANRKLRDIIKLITIKE